MEINIRECGRTITNMGKVSKLGQMEINMKGNSSKVQLKVMVKCILTMETFIRVNGRMGVKMEKEN